MESGLKNSEVFSAIWSGLGICRVLGILLRVKLVAHHLKSSKNTLLKVKQAGGSERNGVREAW